VKQQRQQGFTLVETALAILVVSVGMLAIFSLFPSGMISSKQASDDTYAAMFADEVFNGIRALMSTNDWSDAVLQRLIVPERSSEKWGFPEEQWVRANRTGLQTAAYRPASLGADAVEFAVRYNLVLRVHPVYNNRAYALLTMHMGEFGPTNSPVVAYTEFYKVR
jgi:prepilin-type N-terminal cleavage/methylation domain-containing protein